VLLTVAPPEPLWGGECQRPICPSFSKDPSFGKKKLGRVEVNLVPGGSKSVKQRATTRFGRAKRIYGVKGSEKKYLLSGEVGVCSVQSCKELGREREEVVLRER